MTRIKKILRIIGLIIFLSLASAGVGILGGVPITTRSRKEEGLDEKIELVESRGDEDKSDHVELKL